MRTKRARRTEVTRLEHAAEYLALAAAAIAPLARGAVQLQVSLAIAGVGVLALALLVLSHRTGLRTSMVTLVFFALCTFLALQLVPLPPLLLAWLAASTNELHGYVLAPHGIFGWQPITLDPPATTRELAKSVGWCCLLMVLQHRATTSAGARRRALITVVVAGSVVALIGLAHTIVHAEKLFGLWGYPWQVPFLSTFGNANHLAGALAMSGTVAFGLAARSQRAFQRIAWSALAVLSVEGIVLSGSRGGLFCFAAGLAAFLALSVFSEADFTLAGDLKKPTWNWMPATAVALVLALALITLFLDSRLAQRLSEAFSPATWKSKILPLEFAWNALRKNWFVGIGRGAFETAHTHYASEATAVTFTHVENEALQALCELGVPVGGALLVAIGLACRGLLARGRHSLTEAGAAAGAFAVLLQNTIDFSLEYACGVTLVVLLSYPLRRPIFLSRGWALALALSMVSIWAGATAKSLPGLEEDTQRLSRLAQDPNVSFAEVERAAVRHLEKHPADALACQLAAVRSLRDPNGASRALTWLNQLLYLSPQSGAGHLLLGEALARLDLRDQSLFEFRAAAERGTLSIDRVVHYFPDREAILSAVPDIPISAVQAGTYLEENGWSSEAIQIGERFQNALLSKPLVDLLYRLYAHAGRHADGVAIAHRFREMNPKDEEPWRMENNALISMGDLPRARAVAAEGMRVATSPTWLLLTLVETELQMHQSTQVLRELEAFPDDAPVGAAALFHAYRGRALADLGRVLEANDELRTALALAPDQMTVRLDLIDTELRLGRVEGAEQFLRLADGGPQARELRLRLEQKKREDTERRVQAMRQLLENKRGEILP